MVVRGCGGRFREIISLCGGCIVYIIPYNYVVYCPLTPECC